MITSLALAASLALSSVFALAQPATIAPPAPDFSAERDPFELDWSSPAAGIWIGVRPQSARLPVTGTSVIVVGEAGVLVFDGGGTPLQAERVAERIRSETDLPVTHIAISHWHGDHHLGIAPLREAWPDAVTVSHSFTRAVMDSTLMDSARDPRHAARRISRATGRRARQSGRRRSQPGLAGTGAGLGRADRGTGAHLAHP